MSIWKNVITIQGLTRSWSVNNCRVDIESEVYYDLWLWIPQIWEIRNFYPFLPPWVGLPCHLLICTNVNYLLHWCQPLIQSLWTPRGWSEAEGISCALHQNIWKWSVLKYSIERPGFGYHLETYIWCWLIPQKDMHQTVCLNNNLFLRGVELLSVAVDIPEP